MSNYIERMPPLAKGRADSRLLHRERERRAEWIDVREIRERMRMSQVRFARTFGISTATLRHWERGERRPRGPALVLLQVIARQPRAVIVALKAGRFKCRECERAVPDPAPVTERIVPAGHHGVLEPGE
jgi:putative transcriptional regulator